MTIFEFLQELESFFPLNEPEEMVKKRISFYADILKSEMAKNNKDYNYRKITQWFLKNYKYKTFPSLANIIEALPNGEVEKYVPSSDEGSLLVVTLASGFTYEFTVSGIGKSINDLKADIKRKFGDCTYKFYPKGTVIIGGKVFMP